jgi:hypothetical protein
VLLALALAAAPAVANVYTVGTQTDPAGPCGGSFCSLRQLIAKVHATPFAPDTINVPPGNYSLDPGLGALVITDSMTIVGAGAQRTTIAMPVPADRSGDGQRVFDIQVPGGGATPAVALRALKITGGTAHYGNGYFGGDVQSAGNLTLSDVWVTNGSAYSGGGVANRGGTLTIERSLISGNRAPYGGGDSGAIQNFGVAATGSTPALPGHLIVSDSTITGNDARLVGGIFSWSDDAAMPNTLSISNSTIAGNSSRDEPGGGARDSGGGLGVSQGTEVIRNSIIAGNTYVASGVTTKRNCGPIAGGGITSLGHNLDSGTDCHLAGPGDLSRTDPRLGPLRDNGGPKLTLALPPGSPALDRVPAGAGCAATDQRGVARPQGPACDIGAFELPVVPANVRPPAISGSAVAGRTLTAAHGAWAWGATALALQWLRCDAAGSGCVAVAGATGLTYPLGTADVGSTLRVRETASNAFGSGPPATSAPSGVVAGLRIRATVSPFWVEYRRYVKLTRLRVTGVPAGAKVQVRCHGRGCPFGKRRFRVRRGRADATRRFKRAKLRHGVRIQVRVTKPGMIGKVVVYRVPRHGLPHGRVRCLAPGAKKPAAC